MSEVVNRIRQNLRGIEQQIQTACDRSQRNAADVQLITVTKYAEWNWVEALLELGYCHLGESRPQQLEERAELVSKEIQWHLIGQLQRNKIRKVLPVTKLIHSIDSLKLLDAVDRIAGEEQLRPNLLLQVNVSGEETKQGFSRNDLLDHWSEFDQFSHTNIVGLMTMAPHVDDPELARPTFRDLRLLQDELNQRSQTVKLSELSMGMSHDFGIAIEEGATLIRLGSSLFEGISK
ncbi:Pyridoxal phosphate homeostasis protein [Polystyrenella longa]|uniref:Pyridoxal phosphate homeostasis protein n=1 Tax=Polystyrenella longa TaxID=2528007 RepID=A0A518CR23_9PLAN|nr:YggS family pyridoxal phosphate-dependent enzyme [Polystyrenella longa]QDU81682.1 Pyridoxal phosphate homeostasis protein [Polystyrenella longa]